MARDPGYPLKIEHAFSGNSGVFPLRDCLRRNTETQRKCALRSDCLSTEFDGMFHNWNIHQRFTNVYRWFIVRRPRGWQYKPMVKSESRPDVRPEPAKSPDDYGSFSVWLRDALEFKGLNGLQASLARFCDASATHVMKWKTKSVPLIPTLRKVAMWAQVDYESLKRLADKQLEDRANAATKLEKGIPFKRPSSLILRRPPKRP